jgi:hypothetical protein
MSNLDWLSFATFDANAGTVTLSSWAAAVGAALLVLFAFLAVFRSGVGEVVWTLTRLALVAVVAASAWLFFGRAAEHDRADERRGLDQRLQELTARATEPGSSLGCLDATITDVLEAVCEKAVFASPDTVAGAAVFVAAQLALLADAQDYINRADAAYASAIAGLRRAIETDRFGFVAQVLASREGCTPAKCTQLAMLTDSTRVSDHLKDGTFNGLVARYAAGWPQLAIRSTTSLAAAPPLAANSGYGPAAAAPANAAAGVASNDRPQEPVAAPKRAAATVPRTPPRAPHLPTARTSTPPAAPPADTADTPSRAQ